MRLLSKLLIYGVEKKDLCWFESYLFGRRQIVSYGRALSEIQAISVRYRKDPYWVYLLINDFNENFSKYEMTPMLEILLCTLQDKKIIIKGKLNSDLKQIANCFSK